MAGSFEVAHSMRLFLFGKGIVLQIAVVALTMISLED
jgi:hypothetical protein